jgi:hypothetical protein
MTGADSYTRKTKEEIRRQAVRPNYAEAGPFTNIPLKGYTLECILTMDWTVLIGDEFEPEFLELPKDVHDEILAMALPAPAVRSESGASSRRYPQEFAARKHEGAAL